ncbi:hypothetical protein [Streptomyces murinus]|uniref:hypothetical protein n=1 Tax=Streptomyces murinus TaxID=33900 RepID=UPI0037FD3558
MADIAGTALRSGVPLGARTAVKRLPLDAGAPQAADVWIDGDLGFALLLHRGGDDLMAEELYYSSRGQDGVWGRPEHLSGGIVGVETADLIEIERFSPALPEVSALSGRDLTGPLVLLVLLPGERARVQAVRRGNASLTRLGAPLELHHPEQ